MFGRPDVVMDYVPVTRLSLNVAAFEVKIRFRHQMVSLARLAICVNLYLTLSDYAACCMEKCCDFLSSQVFSRISRLMVGRRWHCRFEGRVAVAKGP